MACVAFSRVHAEDPLDCVIEPNLTVDVSSSEFGVIGAVYVDKADVVEQGQVIAELRTDVERAALTLARARAGFKAELELLRRSYEFSTRKQERTQQLFARQVVSPQIIDEIRTEQELAGLRFQQAVEKYSAARLEAERNARELARRIIRSPISGVVVERRKTVGEYVEGDTVLQLAQVDPLRVELVVPISMFGKISVGMEAMVTPELEPGRQYSATVTRIDPMVDAATATFGVRLTLPNPQRRLPPGLKCALTLVPDAVPEEVLSDADPVPPRLSFDAAAFAESAASQMGREPHVSARPPGDTAGRTAAATPDAGSPVLANDLQLAAGSERCPTVGPFSNARDADAAAAALRQGDLRFSRRETSSSEERGYLVLSPDQDGDAARTLVRLGQAGVSDHLYFATGRWHDRISYGFYLARSPAERRQADMAVLGFPAEIELRTEVTARYWLDLLVSPGSQIPLVVARLLHDAPAIATSWVACGPAGHPLAGGNRGVSLRRTPGS